MDTMADTNTVCIIKDDRHKQYAKNEPSAVRLPQATSGANAASKLLYHMICLRFLLTVGQTF